MARGVEAQANRSHVDALVHRRAAFHLARSPVEAARALRDGAASHGYLGELDEANTAATASVKLLEGDGSAPARELAASYDRLARVHVLRNMQAEQTDRSHELNPGRALFKEALRLLVKNDQYRINMLGRAATARALYGWETHYRVRAAAESVKAMHGALRSETRTKHLKVAAGAIAVSLFVKPPTNKKRPSTRMFALARKIMH